MKKPHTPPQNTAREFRLQEAFFSCTDRRGIILEGNEVFRRVSGYTETELIGQPHNLIRHPDVPRVVFQLLWDHLLAGQSIAAYVKNMAKDGTYYWVLALISPSDDGFISVRFKPTSELLPVVERLYQRMRAKEIECEQRGDDGAAAMAAAAAILQEALREKGFASYDDFMRLALLQSELDSRDAHLQSAHLTLFPPAPAIGPHEPALLTAVRDAYTRGCTGVEELHKLYSQIDELAELNQRLQKSGRKLNRLTADFNIVSFNIALRASKLGHEGRSIAVIAHHLNELSEEISGIVGNLTRHVATVSDKLGAAIFSLAWARLQFEMAVIYYREVLGELHSGELQTADAGTGRRLEMIRRLRETFGATGTLAVKALGELAVELRNLDAHAEELGRIITALLVAKVGGLIEASRLNGEDSFSDIFSDVRDQIMATQDEFKILIGHVGQLLTHAADAPLLARTVGEFSRRLEDDGRALQQAQARSAALSSRPAPAQAGPVAAPSRRRVLVAA